VTKEQLISDALALPLPERVSLAQALWESIDRGLPESDEAVAIREAIDRDNELSSGKVIGSSHEEVMQEARKALKCD
jgi:putative addiction module component (TIGR02574 family)